MPGDDGLEVAVRALSAWRAASGGVTIVALDGHGASGKSTIADSLSARTGASLVRTDDFFVPQRRKARVPRPGAASVAAGSAEQTERGIGTFYDLTRLRVEGLEPLRAGREAVFDAFAWDLGAVCGGPRRVEPNDLVLVEGVCSAAPELGDLVDRAIYVDTPEAVRLQRLRGRVAPQDWDEEWLRAEKAYFARTRPLESFDLVICGTGALPPAP